MNDTGGTANHPGLLRKHSAEARNKLHASHNPFVPILLIGCAFLGSIFFNTRELAKQHEALIAVHVTQRPQVQSSRKLRAALNGLALDIKQLAETGDPGAELIVRRLGKLGITIHRTSRYDSDQQ